MMKKKLKITYRRNINAPMSTLCCTKFLPKEGKEFMEEYPNLIVSCEMIEEFDYEPIDNHVIVPKFVLDLSKK